MTPGLRPFVGSFSADAHPGYGNRIAWMVATSYLILQPAFESVGMALVMAVAGYQRKYQEPVDGGKGSNQAIESRLSRLAYAPEIAHAMLQRQQAEAAGWPSTTWWSWMRSARPPWSPICWWCCAPIAPRSRWSTRGRCTSERDGVRTHG